jgi:ferric-dicitrate binding protein FerR (iron transport regulator)
MIQKSDIAKLDRFRKGLSDREEKQYIYSLFTKNEDVKAFKQHFSKEFEEYLKNNPDEHHNLSYILDRIHHTIHRNENKKKRTIAKQVYKWYSLAAAVLLIPILIVTMFAITGQKLTKMFVGEAPATSTLYAPMGARISFSLPDGSKGWLNSGSSLEYSIPFSQNRQVAVSGEAWLDVAADKNHPFEVSVGTSKVKVIGTKFNINAYPEENHIEVILEEGKVEFSMPGLKSDIEMKPSERLVFSEGAVNIAIADVGKYSAWTEGKLVFRADPMAEVAKRIERWYNVDVELVDKDLEKDLISGTFQDDLLEDVLHYLSMTSPIRYQIIGQQANAAGIIQKSKVLLYRKKIKQ